MVRTRVLLLTTALLMAGSLACSTVANMLPSGAEDGSGTAPGAGETQGEVPTLEPGVEPTAADVQRIELPPTPTPFRVIDEDDPRAILDLGDPEYVDYFDDPNLWWDYDTPGSAAYGVTDGRLWGLDYAPEKRYSWWSYTDKQADLAYAEVSATNGDCINRDAVGFVIHSDPQKAAGGYALEVSCDGAWRVLKHRIGEGPKELVEWTESDVIRTGEDATNRLGIWYHFGTMYFFINGEMVGEAYSPHADFPGGTFALYVKASETEKLMAWFDDLAFWVLPFGL